MPAEDLRDVDAQFNEFKVSELETKYSYIQWLDYFNALMPEDMKISLDDTVIVRTPDYFEKLDKIVQITSKRTMANYFVWR